MVDLWDLKVVGFVRGLFGEYTKYPRFLCLWDGRTNDQYYVRQEWPLRQELKPGPHNVQSHPLVEPNKILLLTLYFKLCRIREGTFNKKKIVIDSWKFRILLLYISYEMTDQFPWFQVQMNSYSSNWNTPY